MLGEEEEQPNMTDSNAFPSLPAKQEKEMNPKTKSIWAEPSKSIIGVNVSLILFLFYKLVIFEESIR